MDKKAMDRERALKLLNHISSTAHLVSNTELKRLRIEEELLSLAVESHAFRQDVLNKFIQRISLINKRQLELLGHKAAA